MEARIFFFIRIVLSSVFLSMSGFSAAQYLPSDTTGYLPLTTSGALDYNLLVASEKGYHTEVEKLILKGADIECTTSDGATPLVHAVVNNNFASVMVLIAYNADLNKVTDVFETPLLISVKNNLPEIAEALIRNGADINYQDKNGVTPLNFASIYNNLYIADLLLYYDADINQKANDGTTPLMAAIWAGNSEMADLLIRNGANLEARDIEGYSPFLIAAQQSDTLILKRLLKNKIDIYEKNRYQYDALNLAIKSGSRETTEFLIRCGDKWSDPGRDVLNPYYVAAKYQRKEIIKLLEMYNFPSKYTPTIDQMHISTSALFTFRDFYSGFSFSFKEPLFNSGFFTGLDTKLWYTKVLIKEDENLFYQYMDKSSVFYAGFFREFKLTDNIIKSNYSIRASLAGAWFFGNRFKGTAVRPESQFKLIPEIDLKWSKRNIAIFSGIEFLDTKFHQIGPVWFRTGCSVNFYFDNFRASGKNIRWY
jgi:ankyrin repeat protein